MSIHYSVVHQPAARPTASGTLPRDLGVLVGRDTELERIMASSASGRVVTIHTIDGMAGIGKTTLAVRAAHQLAPKFPDGQYFVELHAHTPGQEPAEPADVLARLLTDIGVDPRFLPAGMEGRRDLWRDRTTGKKMLLILDDARDHAHVEPLLPGTGGCLTLITSRRHLTALDGAVDLPLDTLEPDAAAELFVSLARRSDISGRERDAVQEIVRLCGYLPLAIVLLAGRLAHHRSWSIADMAADFGDAQDRLDELEAGPRSVQAAFAMSYQDLPSEQQHMFRCLGLHPGLDIDAHAAASLANVSVSVARLRLDALYTDHFVEEIQPGRYRMHDLLRAYARNQADTDSVELSSRALDRLLDYYHASAASADRFVARYTQPAAQPFAHSGSTYPFDRVQALKWLHLELDNLLACLDYAFAERPARAIRLAETLAGVLEHDGLWKPGEHVHRGALNASRHLEDRLGEANALSNLGIGFRLTGEYGQATDLFQQALDIYRELGNGLGEANSLFNLGSALRLVGDYTKSAELLWQSLDLHRENGNHRGEAYSLMILGLVRLEGGDYTQAIDLGRGALALYRELDIGLGEAFTLMNLGQAFTLVENYAGAAQVFESALSIFRGLRYRYGEAEALALAGGLRRMTGDHSEATQLLLQALSLQQEAGHRSGEAFTLTRLGEMRRLAGEHAEATELLRRALALSRNIGHQRIECEALNALGALLLETDEVPKASETFAKALALARATLNPLEQARALEGSARCRFELGNGHSAAAELRAAIEIYSGLASPELGSARALLAVIEGDPGPALA